MGHNTGASGSVENRLKAELRDLYHRMAKVERTNEQLIKGFEALVCAVSELVRHHYPVVTSLNLHEVKD